MLNAAPTVPPFALKCFVTMFFRYDASGVTKDTRIKFMTDGILLREIQEVSVVVHVWWCMCVLVVHVCVDGACVVVGTVTPPRPLCRWLRCPGCAWV